MTLSVLLEYRHTTKRNHSRMRYYLNKLIGSVFPPPAPTRLRSSDVTQGIVGGAYAFILRISSFFGLAPLRFKSKTNGYAVTLSIGMCIYSYLLITALLITAVVDLAIEFNLEYMHMKNHTSQVVLYLDVLIVMVIAGASVYGAPRRMREMLKFLESVASVDKSIGTQCYSSTVKERDFITNCNVFYVLSYVVLIFELQFAVTVLSVRKRFQAVNDALALTAKRVSMPVGKLNEPPQPANKSTTRVAPAERQRANNTVGLWMDSPPEQDHTVIIRKSNSGEPQLVVPPHQAISQLASLHSTLCEVVHRINDSYGVLLIIILMLILLRLIITPYCSITETDLYNDRVHFLLLQFLWCVSHILVLVVIVEPCHLTSTENKKTQQLVSTLMTLAPSTGALSSNLELFSRQLMLRSAEYSPLGMCILDRSLLASIFGTVTTYLVILIQFQKDDDSKQINK